MQEGRMFLLGLEESHMIKVGQIVLVVECAIAGPEKHPQQNTAPDPCPCFLVEFQDASAACWPINDMNAAFYKVIDEARAIELTVKAMRRKGMDAGQIVQELAKQTFLDVYKVASELMDDLKKEYSRSD